MVTGFGFGGGGDVGVGCELGFSFEVEGEGEGGGRLGDCFVEAEGCFGRDGDGGVVVVVEYAWRRRGMCRGRETTSMASS